MNEKDNKFKILSIDGGGIRGIIPAKVTTSKKKPSRRMARMLAFAIILTLFVVQALVALLQSVLHLV